MSDFGGNSFRLGEYLVLPQHNKLVLKGEEYKVEPKIMQVLCYLISHRKEVVSRDKIAEEIWPDSVIGLEVVTRAIFELRKILKDDPKKPVYIETIARKGYCFIYEMPQIGEHTLENTPSLKNKISQSKSRNHLILSLITGFIFVTIILWFINESNQASPSHLEIRLLTDTEIYANSPAISPDGTQVLFIKKNNFKATNNQLIFLDIATQKRTVIDDGLDYRKPKWSKDNNFWYYIKCQTKTTCEVIQHEISSAKQVSLYQVKYPLFDFALSDNSKRLFLALLADNRQQLAEVNLGGANRGEINGEVRFINTPEENNSFPTISHDNKSLYYVSTAIGGSSHLYQYDIASQTSTLINDQFSRIRGLSLKDDKTLWLSGQLAGQLGIWYFNTINKKITPAFNSLPGHTPSQISSHVQTDNLIYENRTKTINIESAGEFALNNLSKANSSMIDMNAAFATNTKTLYFSSNRSGLYELWRYNNHGLEKVTNIQASMIERPIINFQEDKIAFVTRAKTNTEMTVIDLNDKSEITKIILPKKVFLLSWSNDQQFIYFSAFEAGQYNIYKLNLKNSTSEKILLNAGAIAQESQDGSHLYYGDMLNGQLMRKTPLGGVDVMFKIPASDLKSIMPHRLKVSDEGFYYFSSEGRTSHLKYYSFKDKTLQVHLALPNDIFVTDIVLDESVSVIFDRFNKVNSNLIELH